MSNEAPFDGQNEDSLKALAKVVQICLPAFPCKRSTCKRCRKNEEAWNNAIAQADSEFHMRIFGELD